MARAARVLSQRTTRARGALPSEDALSKAAGDVSQGLEAGGALADRLGAAIEHSARQVGVAVGGAMSGTATIGSNTLDRVGLRCGSRSAARRD